MAWKAECNRRKWYCILGWDAVSWFSEYNYNEWRRSLTPAQIRKLEEYEKKQKEKSEKDLKGFCCNSNNVYSHSWKHMGTKTRYLVKKGARYEYF